MAQQDDFDRGVLNRRAVLGDAWVDKSLGQATAFNAEFQSLITRFAWNDIWGRPGLDHTIRRLLVLGMTMGMARWEEFELHCRAAIRGGVSLDTIKEVLLQGAIYCGVPAANTAFKITTDILRAEGLLPAAQSLAADVRVATHHTFSEPQLKVCVQGSVKPGKPDDTRAPIVLSHALGLNLSMWDALAAQLAEHHEVLRYDHRGHGGSAVPAGPYSMLDLVDDAARLIHEWGRGPVVWVGLSMGGMVGQGLAIRHPELISKLVLANTAAKYPEASLSAWAQRIAAVEAGGLEAIANTVMERYFHAEFRATETAAVAKARATLLRTAPAGYVAACHAVAGVNWLDQLAGIQCPTLILAGALDVGAPVALSDAMAAQIPGAKLVVMPKASHLSVLEQPVDFAHELGAFF